MSCRGSADRILLLLNEFQPVQNTLKIGAGEGRIGDIDDLQPALWIDDEQARLWERPIGFLGRSRFGNIEPERPHLIRRQAIAHRKAPTLLLRLAFGLVLGITGDRHNLRADGAEFVKEPVQALQIPTADRTMLAAIDHHHMPTGGWAELDLATTNSC